MIIRMDQPLANDYLEGPAACKWTSVSNRFFSIFRFILQQIYHFTPTNIIFSFKTFCLLLQILGSRFNLADLSRTMCSGFSFQWKCLRVQEIPLPPPFIPPMVRASDSLQFFSSQCDCIYWVFSVSGRRRHNYQYRRTEEQ